MEALYLHSYDRHTHTHTRTHTGCVSVSNNALCCLLVVPFGIRHLSFGTTRRRLPSSSSSTHTHDFFLELSGHRILDEPNPTPWMFSVCVCCGCIISTLFVNLTSCFVRIQWDKLIGFEPKLHWFSPTSLLFFFPRHFPGKTYEESCHKQSVSLVLFEKTLSSRLGHIFFLEIFSNLEKTGQMFELRSCSRYAP